MVESRPSQSRFIGSYTTGTAMAPVAVLHNTALLVMTSEKLTRHHRPLEDRSTFFHSFSPQRTQQQDYPEHSRQGRSEGGATWATAQGAVGRKALVAWE
ncbi:hypothetical protein J6590_016154 [Homalodisca vitripennis]|nr:hypothetical protein J6590_016154 [Homalodisca vitripennis]